MSGLPEEECAFFYAAQATLAPELQAEFAQRVANILDAISPFCEPGPGDCDRAIRQALVGLWVPPATEEVRGVARWDRVAPAFDRVSKRAW